MTETASLTGFVVWLTGLPSAGKSTLASGIRAALRTRGVERVEILDGDELRQMLSKELGFTKEDRDTHVRRVAFVAALLARNDVAVLVAVISPYRAVRDEARSLIPNFVEVYVRCPLDELVRRDVKGLYARALRGEVSHFTGVTDPYEAPVSPELDIDTSIASVSDSVEKVLRKLKELGCLTQTIS